MIGRTKRFLAHLAKEGERVMIPTVVVSEYLEKFPPEEHEAHLAALEKNFFLPSYDAKCAVIASQLVSAAGRPASREPGSRNVFKADTQIIATAIAHNAELIVTGNVEEYRRIAVNRIRVSDVPDVWEQGDLLTHADREE